MMSSFTNRLPTNWELTSVGEVYEVVGGGTPSTDVADYWGGTLPWITSADIEGVRQINYRKYVTDKGVNESATNKIPAKSLLVVTRVGLGKIAISDSPICFSQDLQGLVQNPELVVPEYTLYLLSYELQILKFEGRGTTISGITKKQLKDLGFPLPPLSEQHRIVAKIEELLSELDEGIESLKTAREQIKVYRQALLKHAFEGKLTSEWREENKGRLESAEALLQRIKTERAERYEQNLTDWESAGKQGSKPKAPQELPSLSHEELAELPELPEGWGWFRVEHVSDVSGGLTKNQKRKDSAIERPFLRVANVYANKLELDDMHYIGVSESEIERVTLNKGDILIVEGNGSIDQIGRVAIWSGAIDGCIHQNHLIKARPLDLIRSEFILYFLMSELGRKFIVSVASSTSGLHTLSISKVERLFVPLCSLAEQDTLLSYLSTKLSLADQLDQTISNSLQQAAAMRQSILKKAFSGQLVPQDLGDEPAAVLLARIKAEKAAPNVEQSSIFGNNDL